MDCIRECERPDDALYEALVRGRTKCLSFLCTRCRKKGSLIKQFMKHEFELAHVRDERLASARLLEQSEARALASETTISEEERDALKAEVKELTQRLIQLKRSLLVERQNRTKRQSRNQNRRIMKALNHRHLPSLLRALSREHPRHLYVVHQRARPTPRI